MACLETFGSSRLADSIKDSYKAVKRNAVLSFPNLAPESVIENFGRKPHYIVNRNAGKIDIVPLTDGLKLIDADILMSELKIADQDKPLNQVLSLEYQKRQLENFPGDVSSERRVGNSVQNAISKVAYDKDVFTSEDMIRKSSTNCVGRSILGGMIFDKLGLNYLVVTMAGHSVILQVYSNGEVEYRDMLESVDRPINITDDMISSDGSGASSVEDIVKFSRGNNTKGLKLSAAFGRGRIHKGDEVFIYTPKVGHALQQLTNLAWHLDKLGKRDEAYDTYRKALRISGDDFHAYSNLAIFMHGLGKYDEAIELHRKALSLSKNLYSSNYYIGLIFAELGRHEDALPEFRKALEFSEVSAYRFALGISLSELGRHEEAIDAFELCISRGDKSAYLNMGRSFVNLERYDNAKEAFECFIEDDPYDPNGFFELGVCLEKMGCDDDAVEKYRELLVKVQENSEEYNKENRELCSKAEKKIGVLLARKNVRL